MDIEEASRTLRMCLCFTAFHLCGITCLFKTCIYIYIYTLIFFNIYVVNVLFNGLQLSLKKKSKSEQSGPNRTLLGTPAVTTISCCI